jgi:hypothetical protein
MIGWIALDDREVRAITQKIASPGSLGTVDELGLGVITDAIANILFPAFTTLMTRARYFCLMRAVMDCAAREAIRRMGARLSSEGVATRRTVLRKFRGIAEERVEAIEAALAYALIKDAARMKRKERGILGSRNLQRRFQGSGTSRLPRRLFGRQERYPSALYFAAARKLNALADGVRSRDDVWSAYISAHVEGEGGGPWDPNWVTETGDAARLISRIQEVLKYDSINKPSGWWRDARLDLTRREAALLRNRLGSIGGEDRIPKTVMAAFLSLRKLPTGIKGYEAARAACREKSARHALQAAVSAMRAMDIPLAIYEELRRQVSLRMTASQRKAVVLSTFRRIGMPKFRRAKRECARLLEWEKVNAHLLPSTEMRRATRWLHAWLTRAEKAGSPQDHLQCVRGVLEREHDVLSRPARRKKPRFKAADFSLTARAQAEKRRQHTARVEADEAEPLEARVSSGRLNRAIEIFADIAQGLRVKR